MVCLSESLHQCVGSVPAPSISIRVYLKIVTGGFEQYNSNSPDVLMSSANMTASEPNTLASESGLRNGQEHDNRLAEAKEKLDMIQRAGIDCQERSPPQVRRSNATRTARRTNHSDRKDLAQALVNCI